MSATDITASNVESNTSATCITAVGAAGAQGPQGPQGLQGIQGERGPAGSVTECPSGYSIVGESGALGTFCISTTINSNPVTWSEAMHECATRTPHARMCRHDEWYIACVHRNNTVPPLTDLGREFTSDYHDQSGSGLVAVERSYESGQSDPCKNKLTTSIATTTESTGRYRCCLR